MVNDVTQILNAIEQGDSTAAGELLPLIYEELRRLAVRKMSRESPGQTLQPTALVHEAFLRLVGDPNSTRWESRGHFFSAAAEAMRRILIESARRRKSLKRGGEMGRCNLEDADAVLASEDPDDILALDEALTHLGEVEPELARMVELRYFTGLTIEETARALNVSERTVKRNWTYARAWLRRYLDAGQAS